MTYTTAKFDVPCSRVREVMHLQENTLFDLGLGPRSQEMLPSILCILFLVNLKLLHPMFKEEIHL